METLHEKPTTLEQIKPNYVKEIASKARAKFGLPSLAVVTLDSSNILEAEVQGTRIWNSNDKVSLDSYFHIGSCSKSVLAFITAKFIEKEVIQWNTNFFDVFPELKIVALQNYYSVTLKDLLSCKAGIKGFTDAKEKFPIIDPSSKNPRYDFARWLITLQPVAKFKNGEFTFSYSNASYSMAALMLEAVSGKTYEALIEQHIVKGLEIETFIGFPNKMDALQPWGHLISYKGYEVFSPENEYELPFLLTPAGDLSMKPLGFAKYIQFHLKGLRGDDNYLTAESYQYLHHNEKGFSLGIVNTKMFGLDTSGLDGSAGTFFCRAIIVPKNNFAFIIMTNAGSGTAQMKGVDWITKEITKKHFNWWWKFWV